MSDVCDFDHSVGVLIEDSEGLLCEASSEIVHFSSDGSKELVVAESTVFIDVELVEDEVYIVLSKLDLEVFDCVLELTNAECAVLVCVHNSEASADANNAVCTSES